jgi:histidinol-phosphatase (PHP family)
MHCRYSGDSTAAPRDMIEAALKHNLAGVCFTDHLDLDYPEDPKLFLLDFAARKQELAALALEYQSRLTVGCGIELGLQPHLAAEHHKILSRWDFDFVIASSHVVDGMDPYYPSYYEGRTEEEAYRRYFSSILENVNAFDDFDVYGHIDYVVRYGPNKNKFYSYEKFQDILDEILNVLISRGKGIEINTGGFRAGLGEPNPCTAIIRRYRQLGGKIITFGADAHTPDQVAWEFDQAATILREAGFSHYTVFQNRTPNFYPL